MSIDAARQQKLSLLLIILGLIFVLSLFIGRYPHPGFLSFDTLTTDEMAQRLVINLRLPRLLTAVLLGISLSASGAVFQMIFGNPLVEAGFLGVSQGAAFGTALCIVFISNHAWLIQLSAALFALGGLVLSYEIARRVHFGGWVLRLVLAGIVVSALFSAALGLLKYLADPLSQLPEITFWLLGGLSSITWERFRSISFIVLAALIVLYLMRWRLNLLSLNDETAFSLGISPSRERGILLLAATVAAAAMISVSGIVGWVGLIVPHIARRIFGADARYSLLGAMLLGGIFAIICDDLARTLTAGEIPLGILTSLVGASAFLGLMMTQRIKVAK